MRFSIIAAATILLASPLQAQTAKSEAPVSELQRFETEYSIPAALQFQRPIENADGEVIGTATVWVDAKSEVSECRFFPNTPDHGDLVRCKLEGKNQVTGGNEVTIFRYQPTGIMIFNETQNMFIIYGADARSLLNQFLVRGIDIEAEVNARLQAAQSSQSFS
jgi:hypothetical protein